MAPQRQKSFGNLFRISIFSILALLSLTMGLFWLYHEYDSHLTSLAKMREDNITSRKQEVKQQVNIHIDDMRFQIATVESRLRDDLRLHTENGWAVADNIYRANKGTLRDDQIKQLIIEALMPLRYFKGRGYYWILDTDYRLVAHPFRPDFIGKSEADTVDRQGQKFIRDFIRVAQENEGGGFVSYYWNKPDVSDRLHIEQGEKKIAFLKLFKPYGWVIGTGEYVRDVEKELQEQFLARLNAIHYGTKGYIFTHTYDGLCLSHVNKSNVGVNRWDYQDASGMKVVQETIRTGQQPGGGFIEYIASIDPKTSQPARKISYVNAFPEWQWVLGAGVYLDDIDAAMAALRQDMLHELYHRATITVVLILLSLALCYKISLVLSKRLSRELELFSDFFKQTAVNPEHMDADSMSITEFAALARSANQMIVERQKIHADLQQAKEVWEKSFNAISDLVTIQDKDGHIIRANSAACNLLGLKPAEIKGKQCHEVFQHNPARCPNCPGQKTARDCHTHTSTVPFPAIQKTFQISTAPTFDDQGQLEYIVHVAKDISEQKRLEEELIQSRKMEAIGTLAGGIAHDFNNILTSLLGYADLAQEEVQNNGRPLHYIEQVITAGNRAGNLVKQILAFSRKSEHLMAHISPERTVREALQLLRASIPTTVKMQEEITNIDAAILADPTKIHQVVVNLCTNALHSMENQQGTLTIRLARTELAARDIPDQAEIQPGPCMGLSISDTGHGIAPGIIDHIFDPYFTTKEVGKGIGMGLAVVHGIVKEHGGLITVESALGRGTTFHVYLPLSAVKAAPEPAAASQPLPTGNERVLIIDDEEAIIMMLKGGLERFGYQITAKTSSTEALTAITADPDQFDLVITDQTMPDLSGMDLAREVLALRPSLPVILYTGYSDLASDILAKQSGIREFLLKPIDSRTMAGHIRRILDGNKPAATAGAGHQH